MTDSTKYSLAALGSAAILAAAYLIAHRYEDAAITGYATITRDNWTGHAYLAIPTTPAEKTPQK